MTRKARYQYMIRALSAYAICLPFALAIGVTLCPVSSRAEEALSPASRIAVLDFQNRSGSSVSADEALYLSDLARGAMRGNLSAARYLMMTRENMLELLPAGRTISDCLGECAVETGRKLGADFVVTGEVTGFAKQVRVTVNLHETARGNLLGQVVAGAPTLLEVEADLKAKLVGLIAPLRGGIDADTGVAEGVIGGGAKPFRAVGIAKVVVSFASQPAGAMAEVDGQPIGETPCSRALPPGAYRVGIKKVRYVAHEQMLEVKSGAAPKIEVSLTPDFGWLTIETDPVGLPVTVDDEAVGAGPVTAREVSPGAHDIMVSAQDYHQEGRRVVIDRGERETVRIAPVPRNGGINVVAVDQKGNAVAATVKVDGRDAGQAYQPITVLQGSHELVVDGGGSQWTGTVKVVEEQVLEVSAPLVIRAANSTQQSGSLLMVEIPAGTFQMGSPSTEVGRDADETQHQVQLSNPFYMSATEITQAQYKLIMGVNPSKFIGTARPVEQVSWSNAVTFCNELSRRENLQPAYIIDGDAVIWDRSASGYRLPTEAEWEYACRAGSGQPYEGGDDEAALSAMAWYSDNAGGTTHEVGKKQKNAWGMYDMHGNVWEWCWDWFGDVSTSREVDPLGPTSGYRRVVRGGCWGLGKAQCRSAFRSWHYVYGAECNLGFRVARNVF